MQFNALLTVYEELILKVFKGFFRGCISQTRGSGIGLFFCDHTLSFRLQEEIQQNK